MNYGHSGLLTPYGKLVPLSEIHLLYGIACIFTLDWTLIGCMCVLLDGGSFLLQFFADLEVEQDDTVG